MVKQPDATTILRRETRRGTFAFASSRFEVEDFALPITRPLKVEELCKAFVLYRQGKGLDKATLSEDRYISRRLQKHLGGYMAHELESQRSALFWITPKLLIHLSTNFTKWDH